MSTSPTTLIRLTALALCALCAFAPREVPAFLAAFHGWITPEEDVMLARRALAGDPTMLIRFHPDPAVRDSIVAVSNSQNLFSHPEVGKAMKQKYLKRVDRAISRQRKIAKMSIGGDGLVLTMFSIVPAPDGRRLLEVAIVVFHGPKSNEYASPLEGIEKTIIWRAVGRKVLEPLKAEGARAASELATFKAFGELVDTAFASFLSDP